jgi:putative ABC transport system permease protein
MNFWLILRLAIRSLSRNPGRSLLTALGIIIGIAAVIAVIAVGQGASSALRNQISSMGSNLLVIFPGSSQAGGFRGGAGTQQNLTQEDSEAIQRETHHLVALSPVVRGGAQSIFRENNWATSLQGVNPDYLRVRNWDLQEGDNFTEADIRSGTRVCLLGNTVAEQLSPGESLVGKSIRIRNMPFWVLGVLAPKGSTAWGQDQDDVIVLPWTTLRRTLQNSRFNNFSQIIISLDSLDNLEAVRAEISALLRQRHRIATGADDDFTITDMTEITQTITQVSTLMTLLLTVIASISLVVGGIGIMNIMLVSVTERTREIGLRLAVGARRRDLLLQFLVESMVLSGIGGLIGMGVGVGAALVVARTNNWPVLISTHSILIAFIFSAGVGIFFGFYPAWRAARLDPIESLRRE